jgi:tartrate dehydratase alpha subunit/fumarate hydratase class I-like protein
MTEKVKLPRAITEGLEEFYRCDETNRDILAAVLVNANSKASHTLRDFFCQDDGYFNLLLEVLVNGYEVEETPEDKVREYYNGMLNTTGPVVIRQVLSLLNIKIEGVNA